MAQAPDPDPTLITMRPLHAGKAWMVAARYPRLARVVEAQYRSAVTMGRRLHAA